VRKDVELSGVRLKKGDKIIATLAAANFDPQANGHPEKLDLKRKPNRHIVCVPRTPSLLIKRPN
jgi:cytochrome P450 PksS